MSKASSTLAFLIGGAIGAAAVYLTCTDKGKAALDKGVKFIDDQLNKASEAAKDAWGEEVPADAE
ncbi:MAG: hypothetical protein MJY62_01730 [Bacteroidales bacterium]|nr:hypothetical protein [Bacteroidales bacterium]